MKLKVLSQRLVMLCALCLAPLSMMAPMLAQADDARSQPAASLPTLPTSVNINQADANTIATVLNGVGLARAQAIVAYRKANGLFTSVEQLGEVKGVGPQTLKRNAQRIRLQD